MFYFFFLLTSCKSDNSREKEEVKSNFSPIAESVVKVKLTESKIKPFHIQIMATGKIAAVKQANLNFKTVGFIEKILVANSSFVKAGQLLAILDNEQQRIDLQRAKDLLQDMKLELNKLLIEYGGKDSDTSSVSSRIIEGIKSKISFNKALTNVREATLKFENTFLRSPYDGVIANLKIKAYNYAFPNEPFCTIISREVMVVEVSVLESELGAVTPGQIARVRLQAYAEKNYVGNVWEINPVVNAQGLVLVKIRIKNPDHYLLEGMNAQVIIEKNMGNQIVIPKEAVVERSGRRIVFTCENGLAKWNYVRVTHENAQEAAISEGLKAGEKVITEGHLNLGNGAKVEVEGMSLIEDKSPE